MFKLVFYRSQETTLPYCEKVLNGFVYTLITLRYSDENG